MFLVLGNVMFDLQHYNSIRKKMDIKIKCMKHHTGISNIQFIYKMSMYMCEHVIW